MAVALHVLTWTSSERPQTVSRIKDITPNYALWRANVLRISTTATVVSMRDNSSRTGGTLLFRAD